MQIARSNFNNEEEKNQFVSDNYYKIIPFLPDYDFRLDDIINNCPLFNNDKPKMQECYYELRDLLINKSYVRQSSQRDVGLVSLTTTSKTDLNCIKVLLLLKDNDGISFSDLATTLNISKDNVNIVATKLEKAKYIYRFPEENNNGYMTIADDGEAWIEEYKDNPKTPVFKQSSNSPLMHIENIGTKIHNENSFNDNKGNQALSFDAARDNPQIQNINKAPEQKAKRTSWLEYAAWIAGILAVVIPILIYFKIWPFNK